MWLTSAVPIPCDLSIRVNMSLLTDCAIGWRTTMTMSLGICQLTRCRHGLYAWPSVPHARDADRPWRLASFTVVVGATSSIGENGFAKNLPQERIQGDRGENHMKLGSGHFELGQIDPTWGGVQPVQGEAVRGRWEDGGHEVFKALCPFFFGGFLRICLASTHRLHF